MKKKNAKNDRELKVLLGLIDLYLEAGRPIGSNTLKETGFKNLSSATIRNYFANLEEQGYLKQQHCSGGRIPTGQAYKYYAQTFLENKEIDQNDALFLSTELNKEMREVALYLQHASEVFSELTETAVFISSPRFDQDFITSVKLLAIDRTRTLAVILTNFGLVFTEVLFWPQKIHSFSLKRIESYFHFRLTGLDKPYLTPEELKTAEYFYNEVFLRHIVKYSTFYSDDIYKTGFSKLLKYPELRDAKVLTSSLSFFENPANIKTLFKECKDLCVWIEEDLAYYSPDCQHTSVIAIPYFIHKKPVGAIAILGPSRMPYKKFFGLIRHFSEILSENLTKTLYKHKITFREPETHLLDIENSRAFLKGTKCLLLEDQRESL